MALKKPSDFFGNTKKTPLDEVKEEYIAASPEKIEQVSEAFDAFKANLNHIQSLSDFTSTFDSFKENLEKVENVSSEIITIKGELKNLIKQEDLDSAMMAQLLFVEESISKIESKISSINGETVDQIKEDFKGLSTSVEGFLSIDVPKYKKLISESEVRVDNRFDQFKGQVEENLDTIRADVNKEVTTALADIESLGESTVLDAKEEFKKQTEEINETVSNLVETEFPKYKKFFTETELKTEETIKNAIDSYKETIESLNAKVKVFTETEIPKYNNLLIETKLKSEQEVKELEEEVLAKVNSLSEKVDFVSEDVSEKTAEKIEELQTVIDEYKEEIDSISKTYNNLYKDFKKREISDNEKLEGYSNEIEKYNKRFAFLEETVTEDLREIQSVLIRSNETYHTSLKAEVGKFRSKISEQMEGLQMDLVVNEQHIKKQNENIESVKEEIQEVLKRLQLDTIEEKNKELVEKITYLEETISEINEKKLLVEDNPTLPGDPSTNNSSDGLTPLDQKFATLDDLQNHYRLFINRIQQQIATIGGGGAGFIKDLDDVSFDQTIGTNKLLIYDGSKWVGIASTALGGGGSVGAAGTWAVGSAGIHTTKNVGVGTTARTDYALYVEGDQYVDGNITVGGTVTYEDVKNVDSLGIVTARTGIDVLAGGINVVGVSTISTGIGTVQIGVGNTALLVQGDARVTGILTVGEGSITLDPNSKRLTGIDDIVVGSGASLSLAPLFTMGGKFVVDYSELTLSGYNSALNGTYNRQSDSFILTSAPSASGTAIFNNLSGYYYFLHESDNSKIIIYNIVDGYWSAIHSSGSNFSSPSNGQSVYPVTVANIITPIREGYTNDGRAYPGSGFGIEYKTTITDHTSSLGIATASSLVVSGVITATSFVGDGSQLSNIISGVGIQSGSVRVGTGFTDINFTGAGVTVVGSGTTITVDIATSTITRQTETSSGVTTDFTITGGYTVGLIDVYLNGVKQRTGVDFTATDGSTVTMTPFISDGDVVEFQKFDVAVSGSGGSGITTANIVSDSLVVSGVSTFSGNVNLDGSITSNVTVLSTDTGSSAGPEFKLFRNSASPANADYLGQIKFAGESDTGVERNYAKITGKISDASNGTEDGIIEIAHIKAGSQNISARFKSTELMLLNGTDFSVDGDSTFTGDVTANGNIVGDNSTNISGINSVTATSFYGSGANLTGVISGVEVKNNGTSVGTGITAINFSTNVTATASGGIATVTASGGGGGGSEGPSSVMMGMIF